MGEKLIARKGDKHDCPLHGEGEIITGYDNYHVEGQPVARVGDKIRCPDGSEAEILDNDCCMEIGDKKVARLGDKTSHGGAIISAASSTTADDQNTFIRFGSAGTVRIGKNVHFGGRAKQQSDGVNSVPADKDTNSITAPIHNERNRESQQQPSNASSLKQPEAEYNEKNMLPNAELKIHGMKSELKPIAAPKTGYILLISNTLDASFTVTNKNSVNPATFNTDGFQIEAKNEVIKIFSEFKVEDPTTVFDETPTLTLYNRWDNYKFELTPVSISPNEQQYIACITKESAINDGDWDIAGEVTMTLTVILIKNPSEESSLTSLAHDLEHKLEIIKSAFASLAGDAEIVLKVVIPALVIVTTVFYALA